MNTTTERIDMMPHVAMCLPEYFPRISYFTTLLHTNKVILADSFQYSRQSHQNRTPIRTDAGTAWLSIPVRYRFGDPIHAVTFEPTQAEWREQHLKTLRNHYRASAMFDYYEASLTAFFEQAFLSLAQLNAASVRWLCAMIEHEIEIEQMSEWESPPKSLVELAQIWEKPLLTTQEAAPFVAKSGFSVYYPHQETGAYRQTYTGFYPDLSLLDLLFNYGPEALVFLRGVELKTL